MTSRRGLYFPDVIITDGDAPIIDLRAYDNDLSALVTAIGGDERVILMTEDITISTGFTLPGNITLTQFPHVVTNWS